MALPDPKYLLAEADQWTIEAWLAPGASRLHPALKLLHDVFRRLLALLDEEGNESVRRRGVIPAFQNMYYKDAQIWAALPERRRVVASIQAMSAHTNCEGLAQGCCDKADQLDLWIEAVSAIAPKPLASRFVPYLQLVRQSLRDFEQSGEWPKQPASPPPVDYSGLEDEVSHTDWYTLSAEHMIRHKEWFFRSYAGLCPSCGYDRRGLAADSPCPECGTINHKS